MIHKRVLALHPCALINLVELNKYRTVLIIQPLFFAQISLVKLVEPNRDFLLPVDGQREEHFFSALAIHSKPRVHVILLVKTNDCELKMGEDVLFFDLDLSPSLLLVVLELEGAVGTDDGVVVVLADVLEVKHLPVFQVLQSVSCD